MNKCILIVSLICSTMPLQSMQKKLDPVGLRRKVGIRSIEREVALKKAQKDREDYEFALTQLRMAKDFFPKYPQHQDDYTWALKFATHLRTFTESPVQRKWMIERISEQINEHIPETATNDQIKKTVCSIPEIFHATKVFCSLACEHPSAVEKVFFTEHTMQLAQINERIANNNTTSSSNSSSSDEDEYQQPQKTLDTDAPPGFDPLPVPAKKNPRSPKRAMSSNNLITSPTLAAQIKQNIDIDPLDLEAEEDTASQDMICKHRSVRDLTGKEKSDDSDLD